MTAPLRDCSPALAAALAGGARLWSADLMTVTLVDGAVLRWTNWDCDLAHAGQSYASKAPWLSRTKWKVTNAMQVPTLSLSLMALNNGFRGGTSVKSQIHQGLFDGAVFLLSRAYMTTPGAVDALGTIDLFAGEFGAIDLDGITAAIAVKGKINKLDQYVPRNLYQVGCNHAFCDTGCTLDRANFTANFTAGAVPTVTFVPWSGAAPANVGAYTRGTLAMTSGAAAGSRRSIAKADVAGITLSYPLYARPIAGDTFTAFQGCDKAFASGSGQSCTDRANTQHYRGFEFVPPPNAAY